MRIEYIFVPPITVLFDLFNIPSIHTTHHHTFPITPISPGDVGG